MGTTLEQLREQAQQDKNAVLDSIDELDSEKDAQDIFELQKMVAYNDGQIEQIEDNKQHEGRQAFGEEDQPFNNRAALTKLVSAKASAEKKAQKAIDNDSQEAFDLIKNYHAIKGKISILSQLIEEDGKQNKADERKAARTFSQNSAPNIQTKTNTKKDNSIMITDTNNEIYNSGEPIKKAEGKVSAAEYFGAILTKPQTAEQRAAIQASVTTSGFDTPTEVLKELVDKGRTENALDKAGARTAFLSGAGDYKIITIEDNMESAHRDELEEANLDESNPFGSKTVDLKTLRAHPRGSRELFEDSMNAGSAFMTSLAGTISDNVVKSAFVSQGPKAPVGLDTLVTQEETFANGSQASIMNVVNAMKTLYDNNVSGEDMTAILSPTAFQAMQIESDDNSRYQHMPPAVADMPKIVSSGLAPGEVYIGDFSNVLMAYGDSLILESYTSTAARSFAVEFLAALRWDIVVLRPKSLVRIAEASA